PPGSSGFGSGTPYRLDGYLEQITAANVDMSLPVLRLARHSADFSIGYNFANYRNLDEFDNIVDPNSPASNLPAVGNVASIDLGFSYDNREGVQYAYGAETGRRVAGSVIVNDKRIGSDYGDLRVTASYTEHLRMPWP